MAARRGVVPFSGRQRRSHRGLLTSGNPGYAVPPLVFGGERRSSGAGGAARGGGQRQVNERERYGGGEGAPPGFRVAIAD